VSATYAGCRLSSSARIRVLAPCGGEDKREGSLGLHQNGSRRQVAAQMPNRLDASGGRLSEFGKRVLSPITGVSLPAAIFVGAAMTVAALVGATILYFVVKKFDLSLIWRSLAFDPNDMYVYFDSARWISEGGRLYREVPSEYPLLANIIFATVRYLGNLLHPGILGFYGIWIASTWFVYLYVLYRIATGTTMLAALAWLAPAPIYFALFRFDLFPAAATLMSLFAIRRTRYIEGAVWLGVAVALKGYALFLLPAYCAFMLHQRGLAAAIKVGALALAPMILSLLATLTFAGWEGMVAPFNFHAVRTLNGESTYDAINYLFGAPVVSERSEVRWLAQSLQVGCALAAVVMRPQSFDDLGNAFLFAVLGFMSFSVFYSPQFVLWILPLVCFSGSWIMLISAIFLSWLTYLYYPITYVHPGLLPSLFKPVIIAVGLLRLFMMFLAVKGTMRFKYSRRNLPTPASAG
jgi:hypothetical protein